jgi:hypothetical protein
MSSASRLLVTICLFGITCVIVLAQASDVYVIKETASPCLHFRPQPDSVIILGAFE